ncbi:MAG: response regulator [Haloferacaceae archaeon]
MTRKQSDSEPATVLIVEDEPDLADLYTIWLNDEYDVASVYDGEEALEALDESVDVVLLDRRMPGVSGDRVLERIRERDLNVRVAIVSAVTPDFDVIGMGFDDYVVKPVDSKDLRETVERMLTRSTYDETVQKLERLLVTRATLEAEKSPTDLEQSDEYQRLTARIEEARAQADAAISEFDEDDYRAAFRDIGSANRHSG